MDRTAKLRSNRRLADPHPRGIKRNWHGRGLKSDQKMAAEATGQSFRESNRIPHSAFLTACPPNWLRRAASILAPNGPSWRERNLCCSERVMTGAGTASSMDS